MRATLVISGLVLAAAPAAGCRSFKGGAPPAVAAAAGEAVRPSGVETRATFELPNGLRVILEENHAAPVVAAEAWVRVGAADDPPGAEGQAHLFERLLLESAGAGARAAVDAGRRIASSGGRAWAFTSFDETVYGAVVAAPFAELAIDLCAAVLTQPAPAAADVEAARAAARAGARRARAVPERIAADVALGGAFGTHPYGRSIFGSDGSLAALTPAGVAAFFERHYGAANTTLVVVGDFDPAAVRSRVAALFGAWRAGAAPPARAALPEPAAPRVLVRNADVPEPLLVLAFRAPAAADADLPALELVAAALGGGVGRGRLDLGLARNRQVATGAGAYLWSGRDAGLLVATVTLAPGRVDEAARAALDEVLRLGREPLGAEELADARARVEGAAAAGEATIDGYARRLGRFALAAEDADLGAGYLRRVRELDAEGVRAAAARLLRPANLVLGGVLPEGRDAATATRLTARLQEVAAEAGARAAAPAAASHRPLAPGRGRDVLEYALPGGARLLVLPDDTAASVSVRAAWPGGLRLEDPRSAGATTLLARLLTRGTKTRTAADLAAALVPIAGTLAGVAAPDSLGLGGEFLASRWERGLELFVDCLRNPRLADDEIEQQRRVVLDEIRARDDDPAEVALRLFHGALWRRHPYRLDLLGTSESLSSLTRRRLLDHYRRHYGPRGLALAVVGDVDPDRVAAKLQALLGDAADAGGDRRDDAPPAVVALVEPPPAEPIEVFEALAGPSAEVILGFPGATVRDPDRYALEVLAEIAGARAARLTVPPAAAATATAAAPVRRALAESAGALSREGVDVGYVAVYAAARPDALPALVAALRAEVGRLAQAGAAAAEVAEARRALVGRRALALERRAAVAAALAVHAALGDDGAGGRAYRRDVDLIGAVTADDVARAARRFLDPRREVLAVVRPAVTSQAGRR